MIPTFITVISVLVIMICLAVQPPKIYQNNQKNHHDLDTEEIINDFEKELQKEIRENFESEPAQAPMGWSVFESGPFNNVATHPNCDPVFYEKRIYRKPYRWPFTFKSTYPIEHQSTLDPKY